VKRVLVICLLIFSTSLFASEEGEKLPVNLSDDYYRLVWKYSVMFNIPAEVLVRQDYLESSFQPGTIYEQSDGFYSIGYKQINVRWLDYFEEHFYDLDEPFEETNQEHLYYIGVNYLSYLIESLGSPYKALVAYNCGETKVRTDWENVPQRSKDYAFFILTGIGRGVYEIRETQYSYLID